MIELARPGLAVAGLLAALVPLVLHLIARRPAERVPLPTTRFLEPDPRVATRMRRRPTDLLLLALRMLLLALVGAGLAGPAWFPDREGTAEVVLLDRGSAMRGEPWRAAVGEARRRLLGADGQVRGELVLFDTAAVRVGRGALTPAWFDSLAGASPSAARSDYAAALRALPEVGRELRGADSARATLLTVPRWTGWRPGLAAIRRAAWPGALALPSLGASAVARDSASSGESEMRGTALVAGGARGGIYVTAALEATGWSVRRLPPGELPDASARLIVLLASPSADLGRALVERVRGGATLVVGAGAERGLGDAVPWRTGPGRAEADGGTIWLGDDLQLTGALGRLGGGPAPGATTIGAWDDGRPAIAASRPGSGCIVSVGAALEGGRLPLSAAYPRLLDRLARGCESPEATGIATGEAMLPLDSGALAILRGDGQAAVAASAVAGPGGGVPLGRWVLAAALLVAIAETMLAYGRRTGR